VTIPPSANANETRLTFLKQDDSERNTVAGGCLREALGSGTERVLKQSVRRGRNERNPEAYPPGTLRGGERCENEAGGLFQHSRETGRATLH
jgi:xanthine/CO dehydrogenase XdhC/CoxF family maturation factor